MTVSLKPNIVIIHKILISMSSSLKNCEAWIWNFSAELYFKYSSSPLLRNEVSDSVLTHNILYAII